MFALAALCLLVGLLPGFVIDALRPVVQAAVGDTMPMQSQIAWLSIAPIAASRSSYNGLLVALFILISSALAATAIHRFASAALRRAPAWDCGFPDPSPATQYTAESFSQPIRRVFGGFVFSARAKRLRCRLPATCGAAKFHATLRDPIWDSIYLPIARSVEMVAARLNAAAVPHHPAVFEHRVRGAGGAASGAGGSGLMSLAIDLAFQLVQMTLVIALAPLLTGLVRKVKARLTRKRGASIFQPYCDLYRLARKEAIVAESASPLFRVFPYIIFAATWVAAALVPTFATGLLFSWSADLIAIVALLGAGRFFLALAGMDVGTSFGGLGSSREAMFATLAEPAMLATVFSLALIAGSTQLSTVAAYMASSAVGLRVTLGMGFVALVMVALAENGRIPIDNPATHLELTMVHEAMVLEYSGRHLAVIELASMLKLLLYISLIACVFAPWTLAIADASVADRLVGARALCRQARNRRRGLGSLRDQHRQNAGVPRPRFPRRGADARLPRRAAAVCFEGAEVTGLSFDVSHLLAGALVLISFMLLYQTRLYALLNVYSAQAVVLSASVAWQAFVQDATHLYVTAAVAFAFKALAIPIALHRIIAGLGIERDAENVVGIGPTMLAGLVLVALSVVVMLRITGDADVLAREDFAFALSVVLLGMLMMVVRRNAVSMVIGFMSLENGLILAAAGAKGMPFVVEVSVGFSVLVAITVIGVFLFGLRDRFKTVDASALDRFQGDRR